MPDKELYWKNREKYLQQRKDYVSKNKDKIKEYEHSEHRKELVKVQVKLYKSRNPEKWKAQRKRHKQRQMERKKELVLEYKKDKCCSRCGYKEHPEILQFHHTNPINKSENLAKIKYVTKAKKEMDKCILLCPNCHFLLHSHKEKGL